MTTTLGDPTAAAGTQVPDRSVALMQFLVEVERQLPVDEWRVAGLPVWPLIRLSYYAETSNVVVASSAMTGGASDAAKALRAMRAWAAARARDWRRERSARARGDVGFLAASFGRQPMLGGRRVDPMVWPYATALQARGLSSVVWETAPYGEYNVPRALPSAYVQPWILAARVKALRTPRVPEPLQLEGFDRFVQAAMATGWGTFRYRSIDALRRDVRYVLTLAEVFGRWVDASGIRLAAVSDYGPVQAGFALACARRGVPVLDIQHGVQGPAHPAYASWTKVPVNGYPTRASHFWCWDELSAESINAWTSAAGLGRRAVAGGALFDHSEMPGGDAISSRLAALRESGTTHVLVSLDSMDDPVPERLAALFARAPQDWSFWLRLHPANQRHQAARLHHQLRGQPWRVRVEPILSEAPLALVLGAVDAHVTPSWSSVVLDAARHGVRSVALHARARDYFAEALADGTLRIATQADDAVAQLEAQVAARGARLARPRIEHALDTLERWMAEPWTGRART